MVAVWLTGVAYVEVKQRKWDFMAKADFDLEQQATWEMNGTSSECVARLAAAVIADGGKVTEQDEVSMSGKYGSQVLMRFFGAWFTKWMTLKFEITLTPTDGGCAVTATVREALGVGTTAGFRGKWEKRIALVLGNLQQA